MGVTRATPSHGYERAGRGGTLRSMSVAQTRFSDDGFWWWDGASWKPAVSPDRLWRWNGQTWVPAQPPVPPAVAQGGGAGRAVVITVGVFLGVLVLVSAVVTLVLVSIGPQINNVIGNVFGGAGS